MRRPTLDRRPHPALERGGPVLDEMASASVDRMWGRRVHRLGPQRWVLLGLAGALSLMAGGSGFLAMISPPYRQDESSHVGYTLAVLEGELPTVTTPVPTKGGGPEMHDALRRPYPFSDPEIHVANNPPFPYAVSIPFAATSRALGVPGGAMLGLRAVNVLGAVGAVLLSYLLGKQLAGDDSFVGLVAAGLVAGLISVSLVSSLAGMDGPAFLVTTGMTWALARFARTPSPSEALHLGAWCAAASAARPMSLALAVVAGALALVLGVRASGAKAAVSLVVRLAGPTIVFVAWFYLLNVVRYGDPTGSAALFEKYDTPPGPGLLDALWGPETFVQTLDYLVIEIYGQRPWWGPTGLREWSVSVVALAMVTGAVALAWRARAAPSSAEVSRARPDLAAWGAMVVLGAVPMVLIAQHMSGGGAGHARYLMPVLPIVAAATALVISRIDRRLAVAAVAVAAVAHVSRLRHAGHLRVEASTMFARSLQLPSIGHPWRGASLILAAAGAATMVVALVLGSRRSAGDRRSGAVDEDRAGPTARGPERRTPATPLTTTEQVPTRWLGTGAVRTGSRSGRARGRRGESSSGRARQDRDGP